ncbi:MAG: NAD(P)/FAD-dependent oxidoreductase [Pseudomonadota bacterium]
MNSFPKELPTNPDIVVIGAGAAGIAATRTLVASDLDVVCLEADSRVGGRAHTDTELFGVPFDVGAHWLHCEHVNALKAPGLAMGLDLHAVPDRSVTVGLKDEAVLWDAVEAVFEQSAQAVKSLNKNDDLSLADVLKVDGPWANTIQTMCCLSMGRDPNEISLRDMFSWEGGKDWFCREGFGFLLARLADGLPISLSTPATAIEAKPHEVHLSTKKGSLTPKAVIVTASVGVLAEDIIRFDPPLDKERRSALDQITMGDYGHTALLFHPEAIPLEADTWLTYNIKDALDDIPQGGGFLCNASGTGLTVFETGGSFNKALQEAGSDAAVEYALEILVDIFGSQLRGKFEKGYSTNWRHEPYVRGSYSGAMPGASNQREILAMPHAGRIYFAGEATHKGQQASVSGAYLEGKRVAKQAIRSIKD